MRPKHSATPTSSAIPVFGGRRGYYVARLTKDQLADYVARTSPHRVNLSTISVSLRYPREEVASGIHALLAKGYLAQDRRDTVRADDALATFFTDPSRREEIDRSLRIYASHPAPTNIFIGHGRSAAWREIQAFIQNRLHLPWDELIGQGLTA